MADTFDRQQLMQFLKRTGEELKRTGEELKVEAQRLIEEVRDPARQTKLKGSLRDLRHWAEETGKDAAELIEVAVRRVEQHFDKKPPQTRTSAPSAPSPSEPASAPRTAPKTVGKKKGTASGKGAAPKARAKTVGKKAPAAKK